MSFSIDLDFFNDTTETPLDKIIPSNKKEKIEYETPSNFSYNEVFIKDASSSIYFTQGCTSLLVAIYGPKETKFISKQKPTKANLEIYTKSYQEVPKEITLSLNSSIKSFVKSIILLSSYPKCQINICVNILTSNKNDFITQSVIFNGIMLALCLSGIDLKAMVLSKGFNDNSGRSLLISLDANNGDNIMNLDSNFAFTNEELEMYLNKTKQSNEDVYKKIKKVLYKILKE